MVKFEPAYRRDLLRELTNDEEFGILEAEHIVRAAEHLDVDTDALLDIGRRLMGTRPSPTNWNFRTIVHQYETGGA